MEVKDFDKLLNELLSGSGNKDSIKPETAPDLEVKNKSKPSSDKKESKENKKETNPHINHRSRLREKAQKDVSILATHELVEILLYNTVPLKDTNPIAHDLLNRFNSVEKLLKAQYVDLKLIKNMTEAACVQLMAIGELYKRVKQEGAAPRKTWTRVSELADYAESLIADNVVEEVIMMCLSSDNSMLGVVTLNKGDFDSVYINPRFAIKQALSVSAAKVLIAHNHPSNSTFPSSRDHNLTLELMSAFSALRIQMADHLIVARDCETYSFFKNGMIKKDFENNRRLYREERGMLADETSCDFIYDI